MAEMRILMAHMDSVEQRSITTYEKNGGYKTLTLSLTSDELIDQVKRSELRGRGGAGFFTGVKWEFVPKEGDKYLVCNCDESEPGTFKDRLIIEKDPHQLIEGMILACYAIGARRGFIYCRGEFFEGLKTLRSALREAKSRGYLGKPLFGSDFSVDIMVHPGAGAYIAGEETAQLNSLEGFRATPRLKPPFPAVAGLYQKPTVVNNVETLCNVLQIVKHGVEWYRSIGKDKNRGTKIFQVSGHVQKPGCYEFALGVSLREVLHSAGGVTLGRTFKACYPGGSSCSLLTTKDLDISMDFETLASRGSALGTASLIVMDDSADMVKVAHRLMQFYQNESCGKCTPCREGTRWITQILHRIERGEGNEYDLNTIEQVSEHMAMNSFCSLAAGAAPPIQSAIREFKEEFIAYIERNPNKKNPKMKVAYPYL